MALIGKDFIFIHIQKCGGMAVRNLLHQIDGGARESGGYSDHRHIGLPELLAEQPGIDAGRMCFGVVRDPTSWIESRWRFCKQTGFGTQVRHNPRAAMTWMADCWAEDLNEFAENVVNRHPGIATRTMFHMLGLYSDRPADYVVRFESLHDDIGLIFSGMGVSVPQIDRVNVTKAEKGAGLSSQIKARIRETEAGLMGRYYFDGAYFVRQRRTASSS